MVRVKICGMTNEEDLRLAQELGADYAGFIFYPPSPRSVEPARVREMVRKAKAAEGRTSLVGVFVDEGIPTVRRIFEECGLDIVQLHGAESPEYCHELDLPYWKAVRVKNISSLLELDRFPHAAFLLDAFADGSYGGSGQRIPPDAAQEAISRGFRIIVAGGISAENLPEILTLRPFAVDACSSLEERPGKKSEFKMRAFFQIFQELRGRL